MVSTSNTNTTKDDIHNRVTHLENESREQGKILERLATILELFVPRVADVENQVHTATTTLVEIGKSLVRFEEREAQQAEQRKERRERKERWKNAALAFLSSLVVGLVILALTLLLSVHPR